MKNKVLMSGVEILVTHTNSQPYEQGCTRSGTQRSGEVIQTE